MSGESGVGQLDSAPTALVGGGGEGGELGVDDEPDLPAGSMVGEYRVEQKIGEGGFGKVYAAVHRVIGKRAAVKVLAGAFAGSPGVVARFVAEARAVNRVRHRHIVDIFAFGTVASGHPFLVMELLEGATLARSLELRGHLSPAEAIPILRQVARALDAAHAAGIVHRDLKPDNVFLCSEAGGGLVKLLDFGIAKLLGPGPAAHRTRTGAPVGTPLYMAPEQCRGEAVDPRTDIYALGVMAHVMLTGTLLFDGPSAVDIMFQHTRDEPAAMSTVRADLPPLLDEPVLRMLAKAPADRPASAGEAVGALAAAAARAGIDVAPATPAAPADPTGEALIAVDQAIDGLAETERAGALVARAAADAATSSDDGVSRGEAVRPAGRRSESRVAHAGVTVASPATATRALADPPAARGGRRGAWVLGATLALAAGAAAVLVASAGGAGTVPVASPPEASAADATLALTESPASVAEAPASGRAPASSATGASSASEAASSTVAASASASASSAVVSSPRGTPARAASPPSSTAPAKSTVIPYDLPADPYGH